MVYDAAPAGERKTPSQEQMTARDFLQLSALEKWRRYRKIPWKLILAIVIVSCSTANVLIVAEKYNPYRRDVGDMLQYALSPPQTRGAYTDDTVGYRLTHHFVTTDALMASLNKSIEFYFTVSSTSVIHFTYSKTNTTGGSEGYNQNPPVELLRNSNGSVLEEPLCVLTVTRYSEGLAVFQDDSNRDTYTVEYPITPSSLNRFGPLSVSSTEELQDILHTVKRLSLTFHLRGFDIQSELRQCYDWEIVADYHFEDRNQMKLQTHALSMSCGRESSRVFRQGRIALLVILITACAVSQALHLRSLWKSVQLFNQLRRRVREYYRSNVQNPSSPITPVHPAAAAAATAPPTISEILRFTNKWQVIELLCNICNIIVGVAFLVVKPGSGIRSGIGEGFDGGESHSAWPWWNNRGWGFVEALSAFFAWVKLMEFFDQDSSYYVLFSALSTGFPRVLGVMLRFLPLYIGYALLGMALFGMCSPRFKSLDASAVTLFSIANGDSIEDTFDRVLQCGSPELARIYVFSFVAVFICLVLNILLVVVEDSFFKTKAFQLDQRRIQDQHEADHIHLIQWLDHETLDRSYDENDEDEDDDDSEKLDEDKNDDYGTSTIMEDGGLGAGDSLEVQLMAVASNSGPGRSMSKNLSMSARDNSAEEKKTQRAMSSFFSMSARDGKLARTTSGSSSQKRRTTIGADDVAGRMRLLKSNSFKQMFRLKMRGRNLSVPVTSPKNSSIASVEVSPGDQSYYRRKLHECIARLTKLLSDFKWDLRLELHSAFRDKDLRRNAKDLVLQLKVVSHKAEDILCTNPFCLQCALRLVCVNRARLAKLAFKKTILKVKRRSDPTFSGPSS